MEGGDAEYSAEVKPWRSGQTSRTAHFPQGPGGPFLSFDRRLAPPNPPFDFVVFTVLGTESLSTQYHFYGTPKVVLGQLLVVYVSEKRPF